MTTTKKRNILFISSLVLSGVYFLPPSSQVHAVEKQTDPVIQYQTHVQNKGWQKVTTKGQVNGTTGKALQVEAIKMRLTGNDSSKWTIQYRTHIKNIGWQDWRNEGEVSGTTGQNLQVEGIQIRLVKKEVTPPVEQKPVIQLKNVTINQGESFDYASPIVKAVDEKGNPLTLDQLTITGQVNTSKVGKHSLTYTYKDVSATIHVTVKEKEVTPPVEQKPVIQLKNVTINQGETFDYASPIVKAIDENGNPLTLDQLTITGQVNTSKEGKVVLYYTYKDVTEQTIVTVNLQEITLDENIIRQEMVRLVNEYRQENGEQPVKSNDLFHQCTDVRAKELEQLYGHKRPNGKGFSTVCTEDFNHPLIGRLGENIIGIEYDKTMTNEQIAQKMIDGWKSSNPHNMNMLNGSHTDFGFGIHIGDYLNQNMEFVLGVQWFYHEKEDGGEWERP